MKFSSVQSSSSIELTSKIGSAVALMMSSQAYLYFPLATVKVWLEPAILHDQFRLFCDDFGLPVGYVTWAFLAPDTANRLINDPGVVFHMSEWNEGGDPWIIDFVATSGYAVAMLDMIRATMFAEFDVVKSLRRDKRGRVKHVSSWCRRVGRESK